ncbi:MAG: ATP-binding cassette domain-containing protein [Candidatus Zixiibacteriota bacterium]|jgi:ABC-2 type transport system ATP-binding protein
MAECAVCVEELTRKFGDFTAVDHISLTVDKGEIFGFLGANGAGKTTAIRMLTGLLKPTSGKGEVAGLDIINQTEQIKTKIGYMSQKFSLYPDLTGRENLVFYGSAYNLSQKQVRERIKELSAELDLETLLDRRTESLPVGWRQRLALSAALLHKPQILFLDEPTGGVDPVYRRLFWSALYDLAEQGVTIFVTTHYMDEAEYCNRISIMHQGKIIEMGEPLELIRSHGKKNLEDLFVDLIRGREAQSA